MVFFIPFLQTSKRSALFSAASSGSVDVVRAILQKGGEVNAQDKNNITAVHMASKNGHFEILKLLASYGADLAAIDVIGNTAIHYAAEGGFTDICKFLGQRGKNITGMMTNDEDQSLGYRMF